MRKVIFFVVCGVSLICFSSCGSTAPCGLAKKNIKSNFDKIYQNQVLVTQVNVVTRNTIK